MVSASIFPMRSKPKRCSSSQTAGTTSSTSCNCPDGYLAGNAFSACSPKLDRFCHGQLDNIETQIDLEQSPEPFHDVPSEAPEAIEETGKADWC